MDGTLAIENNLQALKRILAGLVAMAGLAGAGRTLPRHLRLVILRLLRPAESAARRLNVASSRGLVVTLPPRKSRPRPATMEPLLRRFGIAVTLSPADVARADAIRRAAALRAARPPTLTLPLFDRQRRYASLPKRRAVPAHAAPRVRFPGISASPLPEVRAQRASKDDPVDATRLRYRLAALAAALDDLPAQARRFACWRARHKARRNTHGRSSRTSPLRPGRPPGGRLARYDPDATRSRSTREIDAVLAHAHSLALCALESPDTS